MQQYEADVAHMYHASGTAHFAETTANHGYGGHDVHMCHSDIVSSCNVDLDGESKNWRIGSRRRRRRYRPGVWCVGLPALYESMYVFAHMHGKSCAVRYYLPIYGLNGYSDVPT
jgi:hypothetical protein